MRSRWLVLSLVASLAVNLFLIGAGAGVIALGARMARESGSPRPGAMFIATQGLPQPDRKNMREMLRQARLDTLADTNRSVALRAQAWSALAADKPDPAAIKAQLAASRQIDIVVRTQVEERIVDFALGLSPSSRAIFVDGMRRVLPKRQAVPAAPASNAASNPAPAANAAAP